MVINSFVDPVTKGILQSDSDGNLCLKNQDATHIYKNHDGIYDFIRKDMDIWKEREHYDKEYSGGKSDELKIELIRNAWHHEIFAWRKTFLDSLGDIRGKKILLLGNGESNKEFYFLTLGAKVVFTDLSLEGVKHLRQEFMSSDLYEEYRDKVEFHALDALNLPFQDEEFDIIYGMAFAHHLEDLDPFLSEISRCLKRNGVCRFLDMAYSPIWELAKKTILRPLKIYSHWKQPRSPADLRAEKQEGYTFERMSKFMKKYEFRKMVYHREWFLLQIVNRHYSKLVNYNQKAIRIARPILLTMKWLDKKLAKQRWMQNNQLMLIWGFDK